MVSVERIRRVVADQQAEIEQKFASERILPREGLEECRKFVTRPRILLVSGVRRAGKSIFAHQLFQGQPHAYMNFDDERLVGLRARELNNVLEAFYELYGEVERVVFDEIQNIEGWEVFANRLQRTMRVVLTGSNATLMSTELATYLTGRYLDFSIFPFSFREFTRFKDFEPNETTRGVARAKRLLREYLETGGFPEALTLGSRFLLRLYEDVITKDILVRFGVRYTQAFKELARLLVTNFACEISYSRLKKVLDIKSVHTVRNYVDYLEASFLVTRLQRFSPKLKHQVLAPKKIYVVDTGIANTMGFALSANFGRLMENAVMIELMRRRSLNPRMELFYWRDHRQHEVDFVIKQQGKATGLVQVTRLPDDFERKGKELESLARASEEFNTADLLVISWDHEGHETCKGKPISFVPLWKWMLA